MKKRFIPILLIISLFFSLLIGCNSNTKSVSSSDSDKMKVHYIDVDQGDAILIQVNNKNLLIDSSTSKAKDKFLNYLDNLNIKKIDYIIATHPHEDHIGNMDKVIEKYDIGEFYAPKVTTTTATFKRMMSALKEKNKKVNVIKKGITTIDLGENVSLEVFSPVKSNYGDELNNYSPVIKVIYKETSFLFTGDAEKDVENEIINNNENLKADVLKVGHHGSSSSTTNEFLDAVNPKIAVISCGKNNTYGHPHKETISKLQNKNIKIYRTDKDGNIVFLSDGKEVSKI